MGEQPQFQPLPRRRSHRRPRAAWRLGPGPACLAALVACHHPSSPEITASPAVRTASVAPPVLPPVDTRAPGPQDLLVRMTPGRATSLELLCPSGYRERATLGPGPDPTWTWGRFTGLSGGDCTLYFKGGAPAAFGPVAAGSGLSCDVVGSTAVCGPLERALAAEAGGVRPEAGVLQVQVTEAHGATAIEAVCAGKRHWVPITSGVARFEGLPSSGCRLSFQGAAGEVLDAGGGRVLRCSLSSAGAACRELARVEPVSPLIAAPRPVAPQVAADGLWIEVAEPAEVQYIELDCVGGTRDRAALDPERHARFTGIVGSSCTVHLRGPMTGRYGPVAPGTALSCAYIGTVLACAEISAP